MAYMSVQLDALDLSEQIQQLCAENTEIGAVASFVSLVRDNDRVDEQASGVATITLEHYPGLTEKSLMRITEQATEHW